MIELNTIKIGMITVMTTIDKLPISLIKNNLLEMNFSIFNVIFLILKPYPTFLNALDLIFITTKNSTGKIKAQAIPINRQPRKDAAANLNSNTHRTIAIDAVVYIPLTTMVAPVSPRDLAKAMILPENIPGIARGKSTFRNVIKGTAPKVLDAVSNTGFTSSIFALIVNTT